MAQIDTRYLKTDEDKKKKEDRANMLANKKGGIFLIICGIFGTVIQVIAFLQGKSTSMFSFIFWTALGVGIIVLGIVMIANDLKLHKGGQGPSQS